MRRFLATTFAVLAVLAGMHVWSGSASADDAQNVTTYRQFLDAINRGDAARALSLFTDDAQLSGVRIFCAPNPCNGKAAIQMQLEFEVSVHLQLQLLSSVNVVNGNVTAGVAHRNDLIRAAGLSRVNVTDTVTFRADKISKFAVEANASDPQTAAFLRALSQPAPAVSPPTAAQAPVIQAPSTGDGGLMSSKSASSPAAPLSAVLVVAALVLTGGVVATRLASLARRTG